MEDYWIYNRAFIENSVNGECCKKTYTKNAVDERWKKLNYTENPTAEG